MKTQSNFYLFLIALISAMGGFLFGYDWVVIGGAKPFYEQYFGIAGNPVMQGWAMSSALIGCLFGALSAMKVLYSFYIVGYLWDIFIHGCHKCVKSHFCALGCPVVVGLIENLRTWRSFREMYLPENRCKGSQRPGGNRTLPRQTSVCR